MSIAMADTDKNASMAASSPSPASPLEPRPLFQYAPLSAPDHIRLLRILAETSHTPDTVAVSLEEFALVDEAYECLSYTWDGPRNCDVGQQWTTNHKLILCNGCAAYIRQNLHDALVDLRTLGILGPIWIDALCINQEMLDERSSQVSMMARIYKGSTRVIVWLGKEDNYTKLAISSLSRTLLKSAEYLKDRSVALRDYLSCGFTREENSAITNLIRQRRWFSRLWTVQETVLARDLVFVCGAYTTTINKMFAAALFRLYWDKSSESQDRNMGSGHEFGMTFVGLVLHRDSLLPHSGRLHQLARNLHAFRSLKTSDPKDKVFSLLGMSLCRRKDGLAPIIANYNISTQELYVQAACFGLYHFERLELLSTVGDSSLNEVHGLPSWVPDLSVTEVPRAFRQFKHRFAPDCGQVPIFEVNGKVLVLHTARRARIVAAGESISEIVNGSGISGILNVLNPPDEVYLGSTELFPIAVRRLCIADTLSRTAQERVAVMGGHSKYDIDAAFQRTLFALFAFALKRSYQNAALELFLDDPVMGLITLTQELGFKMSPTNWLSGALLRGKKNWQNHPNNWMRSIETIPEDLSEALDYYAEPYAISFVHRYHHRRYFRTEAGYLGLGGCNLEIGDEVYIVKGASVPYIFRSISSDPADGLRLVGEAYVHGIMYGEALENGPLEFGRIQVH